MTDVVRPWQSREYLPATITRRDSAPITVTGVQFAFTRRGVPPAAADWRAADQVTGSGTPTVVALILLGPTGDPAATVQLDSGEWTVSIRWDATPERPLDQLRLFLS